MRRRLWLLSLLRLFSAQAALAQQSLVPDPVIGNAQIHAQVHFGVSNAPFDVPALHQAKGQAFVFLAGGRYFFAERLSFELALPWALGSVAQPAGSYADAAALGNPQLGVRYRFLERRTGESALALSGALEIGAPIASHSDNLLPNRVLTVADGIEGRGQPEWFTPGVLPVTASSALCWTSLPWILDAELKLPLLVRVSEADLPSAANTRTLAFASVLRSEARYRLSRRLSLAIAAHLFFDVAPAVEHVRRISSVQDFERLSLFVHFGSRAALVLDLQTAIAGELGGSTFGGGLRGGLNF